MRRLSIICAVLLAGALAPSVLPAAGQESSPNEGQVFVDGRETPRPELEQVLADGARHGLSEWRAIDAWLEAVRNEPASPSSGPQLDNLTVAESKICAP
jgi:hypothetical protein